MFYLSDGPVRSKPLGGIYGGEGARPPTWHRRRKACAALLEKLLSRHSAIWGWRPPCDCWAHTRRAVLDEGAPLVQHSQASMGPAVARRTPPPNRTVARQKFFQQSSARIATPMPSWRPRPFTPVDSSKRFGSGTTVRQIERSGSRGVISVR